MGVGEISVRGAASSQPALGWTWKTHDVAPSVFQETGFGFYVEERRGAPHECNWGQPSVLQQGCHPGQYTCLA